MSFINKLWRFITGKNRCDMHVEHICHGVDGVKRVIDNPNWKHERTLHHEKLVEEHLRLKAYFIAEKDGFRKDPAVYWEEAKRV